MQPINLILCYFVLLQESAEQAQPELQKEATEGEIDIDLNDPEVNSAAAKIQVMNFLIAIANWVSLELIMNISSWSVAWFPWYLSCLITLSYLAFFQGPLRTVSHPHTPPNLCVSFSFGLWPSLKCSVHLALNSYNDILA